jgi:hypothetical protein
LIRSRSSTVLEAAKLASRPYFVQPQTPSSGFELGVDLTEEERAIIGNRNDSLHGRATLLDGSDPICLHDELRRFDVLRTLIHRAVLSLLDYDGPYVDYGARPATGTFQFVRLRNAEKWLRLRSRIPVGVAENHQNEGSQQVFGHHFVNVTTAVG